MIGPRVVAPLNRRGDRSTAALPPPRGRLSWRRRDVRDSASSERPLSLIRILAALGCLLAAACGERPATTGAAPITLVFKHAKILGPSDPVPGLLRAFEAAHPGVRVRAESLTWSSDEQHQFYVVNLEGGNPGFDVMMLDVIWVPEFARAGWLLDLTPFLGPDPLEPYFPAAVEPSRQDGGIWALPWFMNVGLLYYRKDLLARHGLVPPASYAELVAQVKQIRAAEPGARLDGLLWQGKQYEGMVVNVLEAMWANGTSLLGPAGEVFPDPERAAEALGFLRGLIADGVSPPWTTAADEELTRRAFQDGRAVFLRNWPYAMDLFAQPDSRVRGNVGLAPLPRLAARGPIGAGSSGGAHLGVHRGTRHPAEAAALVRFLTGREAERAMALGAALSPSWPALYEDPALVREHPDFPAILSLSMRARPRPVTPAYLMMSTMLQPQFSAALVGVKSPRQAVADGQRELGHLLESLR